MNINEQYENITNKILNDLKNKKYILPKEYQKLFLKYAEELKIPLDNNIIDEEFINSNLNKQINTLETNTINAVESINDKDEIKLNEILIETKKLKE